MRRLGYPRGPGGTCSASCSCAAVSARRGGGGASRSLSSVRACASTRRGRASALRSLAGSEGSWERSSASRLRCDRGRPGGASSDGGRGAGWRRLAGRAGDDVDDDEDDVEVAGPPLLWGRALLASGRWGGTVRGEAVLLELLLGLMPVPGDGVSVKNENGSIRFVRMPLLRCRPQESHRPRSLNHGKSVQVQRRERYLGLLQLITLTHCLVSLLIKINCFGYYSDQMSHSDIKLVLERQLLLQLGDRLKRLRQAQGLGTVEMAARVGITRNTLRAVEAGDPSTAIGTYLRVMSVLGVSGELALLAGDTLQPAPAGSAAARSRRAAPVVQVKVSADDTRHRLQDLQSMLLHEEAVRWVKANPVLLHEAQALTRRWLDMGDSRSASLWLEWLQILDAGAWRKVLGRNRHAQQLRQASPLVTVLPEKVRLDILAQVSELKKGVILDGEPQQPPDRAASRELP